MKKTKIDPQFKKIKKVLEFVWNSPYSSFYRDKYTKAGINLLKDINSMEDFKKLPFLTREELVNVDPYDRFYFPKEKVKGVNFSGNTSGAKFVTILRAGLKNPATGFMVKKALDLNIKCAMVILSETAFWAVQTRPVFRHPSILRCLGSVYDLEKAAKIVEELKVEAIQASPTILEHFVPYLKKQKLEDQIRYIALGGENCSLRQFRYFKKNFKNACFTFVYACAEAHVLGYTCEHLVNEENLNIYHPLTANCYLEVVNPEKESILAVTHVHTKMELPMIRYRTSDVAKLIEEDCPCGAKLKLKTLGRFGLNVLDVRGYLFSSEELEKAVSPFYKYCDSYFWKLYIYDYSNCKRLPRLKLQLVSKKNLSVQIKSQVTKEVSNNFCISRDDTLADLVKNKIFSPLEIEFIDSLGANLKHKPFTYYLDV
ncbi:MAG: hypothetical protein WCV81_05335 [Microgenomates group bacterium]|jgi:phenylacetate-CoA ligase